MRPDAVLAPRAGVSQVDLGDASMLYDADRGTMYEVNRIGTVIWAALDGELTLRELADDLAAVYDEPREAVFEQVLGFVAELFRQGLLDEPHEPDQRAHDQEWR